jgi:hypothetical protein
LKIGKPPRNTREDVYWKKNWMGRSEDQERQITEHDCPRTCYERNCDGNLYGQTPLSSYLDMKSNLVSTPYSTQQQHLNDWNNGELKITAPENTWVTMYALQEREGNPWTHSGTLRRGPGSSFNRIAWRHDKV